MEPQKTAEIESKKRITPADVIALNLQQAPLSPDMAAYFVKCDEKLGFVPNVLMAYSHSMAKLETFAALYNELMLAPSGLSKLEREMIAVVVSAENRCWYCLVAHGAAVRALSGKPELGDALAFNYRVADITPRQRVMLDFSAKMAKASAEIEDADRERLRAAGFSEADIWDIAAVASFYAMSNRMASAVGMKPNPEYHAQAR
ncbi:MAG: hypothetical protein FD175_1388 [Beijerinckiaceae bacterium]|nr:MAG: hypothetical protein FD175_1388 [Beijerinckiaceae bacterium]